jgi:hypothetical protein
VWRVWSDVEASLDVDFAALYGESWAWLGATPPRSVVAAEGSAVAVYTAEVLGVPPGPGPAPQGDHP